MRIMLMLSRAAYIQYESCTVSVICDIYRSCSRAEHGNSGGSSSIVIIVNQALQAARQAAHARAVENMNDGEGDES